MSGHTTNPFRAAAPLLILLFAFAVHAEVRLPAIISDNMVLQQGHESPHLGKRKTR
jgi:transketolase